MRIKFYMFIFFILMLLISGCLDNKKDDNDENYTYKWLYQLEVKANNSGNYYIIVPVLYSPDIDIMEFIEKPNNVSMLSLIKVNNINTTNWDYGLSITFSNSFYLEYKIITNERLIPSPTLSLRKSNFDSKGSWWTFLESSNNSSVYMRILAGCSDYEYITPGYDFIQISPGWNWMMITYITYEE